MLERTRHAWAAGPWGQRAAFLIVDLLLISGSMALSFLLRFEGSVPTRMAPILGRTLVLSIGLKIPVFALFRIYRFNWRHVGMPELYNTGLACVAGSAVLAAAVLAMRHLGAWGGVPRSILGIDFVWTLVLVLGARTSFRVVRHTLGIGRLHHAGPPTLIVGAGDAGIQLARALQEEPASGFHVIGFIDDDPHKQGMIMAGVPVLGPRGRLPHVVNSRGVHTVLIAMPSAPPDVVREAVELARRSQAETVKILPSLSELYTGRVSSSELREPRPEDLLRRTPVTIDTGKIHDSLTDKVVLVTGAAGSIGAELCRQLLRFDAARLVGVDFNETGLFDLEADLRQRFPHRSIDVVVGDVREADRMKRIVASVRPHAVYHAAAYKHVPMMELFPSEAVKTNVTGTRNVLAAAQQADAETFVLISTDKAVNPTSVMGATKRAAEMLVHSAPSTGTRCVAVRFGNVLGSRGSVLRTFQEQVEQRRAVTVTDANMLRYFMVTSEAVQLVLQAGAVGQHGQVLVLDMGKPVRILDLARDVIRFYGLEPDVDVPIVFTGARPGEKLSEELLTAEEGTEATAYDRLFVARLEPPQEGWRAALEAMENHAAHGDDEGARAGLLELIPTYAPAAFASLDDTLDG